MTKRERQYKHIYESLIDRGKSLTVAARIAAATVNKYRAKLSKAHKGPKLIRQGGSRNQYYPGKIVKNKKEVFQCLKHRKRFKTKPGMLSHYRSHNRLARLERAAKNKKRGVNHRK